MKTNRQQHSGLILMDLTDREARVVPLAQEWDHLKVSGDTEGLVQHIHDCYAANCPDMARRAERRLRGDILPERIIGSLAGLVFSAGDAQAEQNRIQESDHA